jgi:hypothetical protein
MGNQKKTIGELGLGSIPIHEPTDRKFPLSNDPGAEPCTMRPGSQIWPKNVIAYAVQIGRQGPMPLILWPHIQVSDQWHFNNELDVVGKYETATRVSVTARMITIAGVKQTDASIEID